MSTGGDMIFMKYAVVFALITGCNTERVTSDADCTWSARDSCDGLNCIPVWEAAADDAVCDSSVTVEVFEAHTSQHRCIAKGGACVSEPLSTATTPSD